MPDWMSEPTIIPRANHTLSRSAIDPDALKVLNRLRQADYVAYLVGGSVRDLLLERRPKDFDIGTSAHPHEVKRLFRNCWIIGRRFRLVHVKFGTKTIEVATFRRQLSEQELAEQEVVAREAAEQAEAQEPGRRDRPHVHPRDNTFGTPEEDAFRRDFTVNALFYDIATFSIIDYTGGLEDLRARVIRSIGDPNVRFEEDPVRMLRAVVLAARLDFTIDPDAVDAIRRHASLIAKASQARLLEEFYKILRSGASERAFRQLAEVGLLEHLAPELIEGPRPGALAVARVAGRVPASIRSHSRVDEQSDPARHAARAARLQRRPQAAPVRGRHRARARTSSAAGPDAAATPRHRAAPADSGAATPAAGSRGVTARAPRADSPRAIQRVADVARHPRTRARGARALEGVSRRTGCRRKSWPDQPRRRRRRRGRPAQTAAGA